MLIPITHAIRAPIMITCGPLKCTLATSAACRAVLGRGVIGREGEKWGRVQTRVQTTGPYLSHLWFFIPSTMWAFPGDDPFECLVVTYFVPSPQQHILLLALDLRFPLPPISPGWEFLLFLFFPGSLLFLCAMFKVVWLGNQPAAESRRLFLFRYDGGQERVSLTISYTPSCASSPGDSVCPSETVLRLSSCWDSQLVYVQIPTDS